MSWELEGEYPEYGTKLEKKGNTAVGVTYRITTKGGELWSKTWSPVDPLDPMQPTFNEVYRELGRIHDNMNEMVLVR